VYTGSVVFTPVTSKYGSKTSEVSSPSNLGVVSGDGEAVYGSRIDGADHMWQLPGQTLLSPPNRRHRRLFRRQAHKPCPRQSRADGPCSRPRCSPYLLILTIVLIGVVVAWSQLLAVAAVIHGGLRIHGERIGFRPSAAPRAAQAGCALERASRTVLARFPTGALLMPLPGQATKCRRPQLRRPPGPGPGLSHPHRPLHSHRRELSNHQLAAKTWTNCARR
jgi:hypothetical protein